MSENSALTVRSYLRSPEIMERFAEAVGKYNAAAYISSVLMAVANNPKLQECTHQSIAISAMRAATLRLSCDPSLGHAYLVPYKAKGISKAILIVGYKGLYQMALRTGKYRYINVYTVREGQEVIEDWKTGNHSLVTNSKGEKAIGYLLSFALYTGFEKTFYMTVEQIHEHAKKYSQSYNYSDSTWKTNVVDMEKKTVLRQGLTKWGYFDPYDQMNLAHADDDEDKLMPPPEDVTIEQPKKIGIAQCMKDLGFDPDPDKFIDAHVEDAPEEQMEQEGKDIPLERPYPPEYIKPHIEALARRFADETLKDTQRNMIHVNIEKCFPDNPKAKLYRDMILEHITGTKSIKDIDMPMAVALHKWLGVRKVDENRYAMDENTMNEILTLANELINQQPELFKVTE